MEQEIAAQVVGLGGSTDFSLWNLYRDDKITKEYLRHNRLKSAFEKLNINIKSSVIDDISDDYVKHLPDNNFLLQDAIEVLDYLFQKYIFKIVRKFKLSYFSQNLQNYLN